MFFWWKLIVFLEIDKIIVIFVDVFFFVVYFKIFFLCLLKFIFGVIIILLFKCIRVIRFLCISNCIFNCSLLLRMGILCVLLWEKDKKFSVWFGSIKYWVILWCKLCVCVVFYNGCVLLNKLLFYIKWFWLKFLGFSIGLIVRKFFVW